MRIGPNAESGGGSRELRGEMLNHEGDANGNLERGGEFADGDHTEWCCGGEVGRISRMQQEGEGKACGRWGGGGKELQG